MKQFVFTLLFLFPFYLKGQILVERFDNPVLSEEWELHRDQFEIKNGVLWLNGNSETADTSSLRRLYMPAETMQWTFDVYLNVNPSTQNRVVIYPSFNEYNSKYVYLSIGGTKDKDLYLYAAGREKLIDASRELPYPDFPCVLSIKLTYEAGVWTLYSSFDKENYTEEGSAVYDVENPEGEEVYFHLQMEYTKTRYQDFGFDNLVITDNITEVPLEPEEPEYSDVSLESVEFPDRSSVLLSFSDEVDCSFASVSLSEIGNASDIDDSDSRNILASFNEEMEYDHTYALLVEGFRDMDGYEIASEELTFSINGEGEGDDGSSDSVQPGSVYISEIMADPKGAPRMPDTEYIELHNTLATDISLDGWTLLYREKTSVPLDGAEIPAGSYIILYRSGDEMEEDLLPCAFASDVFPANLANAGQRVQLFDGGGVLMDDVVYEKAQSGVSWERGDNGWYLSTDPLGGTPGAANSKAFSENGSDDGDSSMKVEEKAVVFNEILPNPAEGGSEYIELFNRSVSAVSLSGLAIATRKSSGELNKLYKLQSVPVQLDAGGYIALTKELDGVLDFFYVPDESLVAEVSLPILNNNGATLVLVNVSDSSVVDELAYTPDWHSSFISSEKGVALERIDPDKETTDATNWSSASSASGYGTPGYENSQYLRLAENEDDPVTAIGKPTYSPSDGTYHIAYTLSRSGFQGNLWVFDLAGRKVATLANQELLETSGEIVWNGTGVNGKRLQAGIYVIFAEFYHSEGEIYREKGVILVR